MRKIRDPKSEKKALHSNGLLGENIMKSRDSCSWNLGGMAPYSDADNANISNSIATSRIGATGRLGTSLTGTTLHNIPTPKLSHYSREANAHEVPGDFGGTERLSPGFDQEATGGEMKNPPTGAMSMKASTPTTGHIHGTWSQSHRFNLFVDPYFHVREGLFFPQHAAGSSVPLCESPGYHQVSPAFNQPGFSTSAYMPGSPDKDPYCPRDNYDRAYETSENTRSALPPGSQTHQPESPSPSLFGHEPASHSDLTHSGRHYSEDFGSHHSAWYSGDAVATDNFYDGSFRNHHRYSQEVRSHSPDLGNLGTQNNPPRPLGDGIQPPFSDAFSHLNRSLVVEPGQPSTSGEPTYFTPDGVNSVYLPPVRRNSAHQTPQQLSQGAFNSAPDHGNIPGCHVLTPIDISQAGDSSGISSPQEAPKKEKPKRKPMPEEERAAVKQNRLNGVCYRCKKFKEKCRGGFPCERCQTLPLWQPVCVPMQFVEKKVFSRGLYKAHCAQQRENIKEWLVKTSTVHISNGFLPTLSLLLNEYVANDTSLLQNALWRGNGQSGFTRISSTPFGVSPANEPVALATPRFDEYLDNLIPLLISQLCSGGHEKVFIDTMNAAYRYNKKSTEGVLITLLALRIWAAQFVFFKHPWRLDLQTDPDDAPGMTVITPKGSASTRITPLPILLNQQLDSLIESKTADLELQFLTELQTRMFLKRPPDEWFGIYLAIFVFFTALEEDTWNLETWNCGVKSTEISPPIEWPLKEPPEALLDRNMRLVDVLAAHFRGVSKGHVPPFPLEGKKVEGEETAGKEQEVDYMNALAAEVKRRGDTLKSRRVSTFDPDKPNSLNMKYSCRLMIATD